nr:MAG TPA: hypothetical protein [Caudoviricetes sp.]
MGDTVILRRSDRKLGYRELWFAISIDERRHDCLGVLRRVVFDELDFRNNPVHLNHSRCRTASD